LICPDFGGVEIRESVGVVGVVLIFLDVGEGLSLLVAETGAGRVVGHRS
jgi:hypothetical protein